MRARLQAQYGLSPYDARVLSADHVLADYFETAAEGRDAKLVANWVSNDLVGRLGKSEATIEDSPIPAADIAELVALIEDGTVSSKIAKDVFERMWAGEGAPRAIVEAHGLVQVTDTGALEAIVDRLVAANPDKAAAVKAKPQAVGWFVGQVMKETAGKGEPGGGQRPVAGEARLILLRPNRLFQRDRWNVSESRLGCTHAGQWGNFCVEVFRIWPPIIIGRKCTRFKSWRLLNSYGGAAARSG